MTVFHFFKRKSQRLAIKMHRALNPSKNSKAIDFEAETIAISRSLIKRQDSELLISPISGKRFIKNLHSQIYFIIQDDNVEIINHTYSYHVKISLNGYQRLARAFDSEVESRRIVMENDIRSNIKHSLKSILETLSNENI
jgi:adenine-specific DNA methylase